MTFFYGIGKMEESYKTILSILLENKLNSLIIERKYFPEIFDEYLIIIHGTPDGLPILERDFHYFLKRRRIIVQYENSLSYFNYKKFEVDQGKYTVWRGEITEGYKKWAAGKKVYESDKERISLYVSEETKKKWQKVIKNNKYSTISELIRESVSYYIERYSKISHEIKEPLIIINEINRLLLEILESEITDDGRDKIRIILDQFPLLENVIMNILDILQEENET